MEITKVTITPHQNSLEPEFHIMVNYSFHDVYRIPVKYNCNVHIGNLRIAFMHEFSSRGGNSERLATVNSYKNVEIKYNAVFVAPLSRVALNKLEEVRSINPKGDVYLNLAMEITFIESVFGKIKHTLSNPAKTLVEVPTLLGDTLFLQKTYFKNEQICIPRSTWVTEYCPVFENRRYQIFELPIPNLSKEGSEIHLRINGAITALAEIEKARHNGDWNQVIKDSRPIWELINHKSEIEKLFQTEDIDPITVESFKTLITSFFDFASKFIHKISRGKTVMKTNNASKEDAELIYAMAFSIVNLISKKLCK